MQINLSTDTEGLHVIESTEKEIKSVRHKRKLLRVVTANIKAIVSDSLSGRLGES